MAKQGLISEIIAPEAIKQLDDFVTKLGQSDQAIAKFIQEFQKLSADINGAKNFRELNTAMEQQRNVVTEVTKAQKEQAIVAKQVAESEKQVAKSMADMDKVIDDSVESVRHYSKNQDKLKKDLLDYTLQVEKAKERIKELKKGLDTLRVSAGISTDAKKEFERRLELIAKNSAAQQEFSQKIRETKKAQIDLTTVEKASFGSYQQREALMKRLVFVSKSLGTEDEKNVKIQAHISAQINKLNDSLKKSDLAHGNHQRSVADYGSVWDKTKGILGSVTGVLGKLGIAVGAATLAKKAFSATMSATKDIADKYKETIVQAEAATGYFFRTVESGNWSNFLQGMSDAMKAAYDYEVKMEEIQQKNRSFEVYTADQEAQAAKFKNDMRDQTKTAKERIAAGMKVQEIERDILEKRKTLAKEEKDATFQWASETYKMDEQALESLTKTRFLRDDEIKQAKELIILKKEIKKQESGTKAATGFGGGFGAGGRQEIDYKKLEKSQNDYNNALSGMSKEQKIFAEQYEKYGDVTDEVRIRLADSAKKEYEAEKTYQTDISRVNSTVSGLRNELANEAEKLAERRRKANEELTKLEAEGNLDKLKKMIEDEKRSYEDREASAQSYYNAKSKLAEDTYESEKSKNGVLEDEVKLSEAKKNDSIRKAGEERTKILESLENERLSKIAESFKRQADSVNQWDDKWLELTVDALLAQEQIEVKQAEKTGVSVLEINKKYDKLIFDAFDTFNKAKVDKANETADKIIKAAMREYEAGELTRAGKKSDEENTLAKDYSKGLISREEYEKKLQEISYRYTKESIQNEIDALNKILEKNEISGEKEIEIKDKVKKANIAMKDAETTHLVSSTEKQIEQVKKYFDIAADYTRQGLDIFFDAIAQRQAARIAEIDAEIAKIEELKQAELDRLDSSVVSEERRAYELKRINNKAEADRKKLEEQKKKEQQKAAVYQKAQAIAQAVMNTALAVTSALSVQPFPVGLALSIVASALGTAQIALIASQKLPEYRFGTPDHAGGYAVVGDGGKPEYVQTPSGEIYQTPSTPTVIDIPKHSVVFPDYSALVKSFSNPEVPKYEKTNTLEKQFEISFERFSNKMIQAMEKNKAHMSMNLDSQGIITLSKKGQSHVEYINRKVKGING